MAIHDLLDDIPFVIEDATCIRETDKAILVSAPTLDKEEWIPQSQIHVDSEVYKTGDEGKLVIYNWLAYQRGWF
jgi:hypothetical protein